MATELHSYDLLGFIISSLLFPLLASASTPHMSFALPPFLTPPLVFLLVCLVVGALTLTSGLLRPRIKPPRATTDGSEMEDDTVQDSIHDELDQANHDSFPDGRLISSSKHQQVASVSSRLDDRVPSSPRRLNRSKSDMPVRKGPVGWLQPQFAKQKMKKSEAAPVYELPKASSSSSTEGEGKASDRGVDAGEVDQQADDFIRKFYQKMNLQRLESILRYKDRIDRSYGS